MKKLLFSLFAGGIFLVSLNAQNSNSNARNVSGNTPKNAIVCYFSASGNTGRLAKTAADAIGADLHEIVPVHKYTSADLNWNDRNSLTTKEQNDSKARPAIENSVDLSGYETVVLAYPIWWGMAPKIMYTFVEQNNLSGKNVAILCTSGGSGLGRSGTDLMKSANGANFKGGKQFSSRASSAEIKKYLDDVLK